MSSDAILLFFLTLFQYITSKNGCTNASTEDECPLYLLLPHSMLRHSSIDQTFSFEISARNFEGAFDRLAHTLVGPHWAIGRLTA